MAMITQYTQADGTSGLPKDASGLGVGWSVWHCMRLQDAMQTEGYVDAPLWVDEYVFKMDHIFTANETDIWDRGGEPDTLYTFVIHAGDKYHCHRDR